MRDGEGTKGTLADKQPGLFACLKSILIGAGSTSFGAPSSEAKEDKSIRTHYLELRGTRDNSKKSAFVQEHVHVFFDRIYWKLRAYYGEKMEEQCMIIVAYKGAVSHENIVHVANNADIAYRWTSGMRPWRICSASITYRPHRCPESSPSIPVKALRHLSA